MAQIDREELEALMKEFPDWKEQFPDVYKDFNPPRYHKSQKGGSHGLQLVPKKEIGPAPLSDYQDTFKYKGIRPRSNKRPPPTPRNPYPPPMQMSTNQRSDFVPKDLSVKPALVIKEDNYVPPQGGFDHSSSYKVDFPGHVTLPVILTQPRSRDGLIKKPVGKFDGKTTTKEFFRPWLDSKPSEKFGEYPCYTGALLYPDDRHFPISTTKETFKGEFARRPPACENWGPNISIQGEMDLSTTNKEVYRKFEDAKPASKVPNRKQIVTDSVRPKFLGETQTQHDYPFHLGHQPPKAITPHPSTIDLRFDNKVQFETEQQHEFPARDVKKHQRPPLVKKEDNMYHPPQQKFQALSHTQVDFQAYDVTSSYQPPPKIINARRTLPKLDDNTSYKACYPKYDVKPRERYGDRYEMGYTPTTEKFMGTTTTQENYFPKTAEIPKAYVPQDNNVDHSGFQDFTTINMVTYKKPTLANMLPEETAQHLLKALQNRKGQTTTRIGNGAKRQAVLV